MPYCELMRETYNMLYIGNNNNMLGEGVPSLREVGEFRFPEFEQSFLHAI